MMYVLYMSKANRHVKKNQGKVIYKDQECEGSIFVLATERTWFNKEGP